MLVGVGGTTAIEVNATRCQLDSITKRGKNRQSRLDRVAVSIVAKNKSRDRDQIHGAVTLPFYFVHNRSNEIDSTVTNSRFKCRGTESTASVHFTTVSGLTNCTIEKSRNKTLLECLQCSVKQNRTKKNL